jgi:hypothetical protein
MLDRFSQFYSLPGYNRKGGRPRKLRHHHQVLGLLMAFYVGYMAYSLYARTLACPTPR